MECPNKKCCHYSTVSLSIILAIVFLGGFVTLLAVYYTGTTYPVQTQYGLVFDAGSSHTSMFVYSWNVSKDGVGPITQVFTNSSASLGSYIAHPSAAGPNISLLAGQAVPYVRGNLANTPVILGATAGMRIARDVNPTATYEIFQSIASSLAQPFKFIAAEIITGIEEGLYAWDTLNYLSKNMLQAGTTNGVLDMGGASIQIASEYKGGPVPPGYCNLTSGILSGRGYTVCSCSYLCYGRDRAEFSLLDYLINSQPNVSVISNPCYPINYSHTYLSSTIYDGDCVKARSGTASSYFVIGTGNSAQCQDLVNRLFSKIVQPDVMKIQGNYVGISVFYYAARDIYHTSTPLPISSNLNGYNSTVFKFCNTPLPSPSNATLVGTSCFSGMYTLFMLQNVLGFGKSTDWTFYFNSTVNGFDIGWTLGYILNRTAGLKGSIITPFPLAGLEAGLVILAILCVVFLLVAAIFLVYSRRTKSYLQV